MTKAKNHIKVSVGILKSSGNLKEEIKELKNEEKRLEERKLLLFKKNKKEK